METPKKHLEIHLVQVLRPQLLGMQFVFDRRHYPYSMKEERNNVMIVIQAIEIKKYMAQENWKFSTEAWLCQIPV